MAFIVEAQPVDDAALLDKPEQPRLRIARLRPWRDRANLGEAEAELQDRIGYLGILVVSGGKPDRIGKIEPGKVHRKPRVAYCRAGWQKPVLERHNRNAMGGFWVEAEQCPPAKCLKQVHAALLSSSSNQSGKRCEPSACNRISSQTTASTTGSFA